MAVTETGHHANRTYRDQDGDIHLNGGKIYADENGSELGGSEIAYVDGLTPGTVTASKAVVVDANKDIGSFRALTLSRFNYTPVSNTATADGLTTGTIADAGMLQFVTVTSDDANKIIVLPTPTVGTIVILKNGGTGYELRTSTPASISINGGAGSAAESAIAANSMVIAVCTSATTWQAITIAATTLAAVEAAA